MKPEKCAECNRGLEWMTAEGNFCSEECKTIATLKAENAAIRNDHADLLAQCDAYEKAIADLKAANDRYREALEKAEEILAFYEGSETAESSGDCLTVRINAEDYEDAVSSIREALGGKSEGEK